MPIATIVVGAALIVLGVGSYVVTGFQSVTALIPAFFGGVFELLGVLALNPRFRKHAMHVAAVVALVGVAGSFRGLMTLPTLISGGQVERPAATVAQSVMAVVCVIFLVMAIQSFVAARRARVQAAAAR